MLDRIHEIKQRIWNGRIGVTIALTHDDDKSDDDLPVILLALYRLSFFGLYYSLIASHFAQKEIWLECGGIPIRWNLPVGVVYDHLFACSKVDATNWVVHVHSGQCPHLEVIPFPHTYGEGLTDYDRLARETIVNLLKESCYVLNQSARPMMNLSEPESKCLLQSIQNHDKSKYDEIIHKVLVHTKRIPVKVLEPDASRIMLTPLEPESETNLPHTLRDIYKRIQNQLAMIPIIQGIDASCMLDVPIKVVWQTFKHLDNFLYVILTPLSVTQKGQRLISQMNHAVVE